MRRDMSAWVIALGLGAGYLINKNVVLTTQLEESMEKFNSAAKPATGGVTSTEIRSAHKRLDHVKYGDMNSDLPKKQMDALHNKELTAAAEVEAFDSGSSPVIQGVMLQFDGLGF